MCLSFHSNWHANRILYRYIDSSLSVGMLDSVKALNAVVLALALSLASSAQDKDFKSIKVLAEKGEAEAQFALGLMYDTGQGVEVNDKEAVKW